jgi:hypothetical protein
MTTRAWTARATLPAILVALAGCFELDLTGLTLDQSCCGGLSYEYPLTLTETHNMLSGDTARISTFASRGDPKATWVVTGPAVFVRGRETIGTRITTPVDAVTIRGTGNGVVTVKAVRTSEADSAAASIFVADSARVTLSIAGNKDRSVRVGGEIGISAQLLDANGRWYLAALAWSSSDTSIVTLSDVVNPTPVARMARGRAAGAAKITVAFGTQRDTVGVAVVP